MKHVHGNQYAETLLTNACPLVGNQHVTTRTCGKCSFKVDDRDTKSDNDGFGKEIERRENEGSHGSRRPDTIYYATYTPVCIFELAKVA